MKAVAAFVSSSVFLRSETVIPGHGTIFKNEVVCSRAIIPHPATQAQFSAPPESGEVQIVEYFQLSQWYKVFLSGTCALATVSDLVAIQLPPHERQSYSFGGNITTYSLVLSPNLMRSLSLISMNLDCSILSPLRNVPFADSRSRR